MALFNRAFFCLGTCLALATSTVGCSDDQHRADESQLLLSRVSVAIVPGGKQQVDIESTKDEPAEYQVVSSDNSVATATVSGTHVTIHGVALGKCSISVTNATGLSHTLPVRVYDPRVLETDDLTISFTTEFELAYQRPTGILGQLVADMSFWRPIAPNGFYSVGSLVMTPGTDPNGVRAAMVLKAKSRDALVLTDQYQLVSSPVGIGWTFGAAFWRPACPAGYVALGMVATGPSSTQSSPAYSTACVRKDLTSDGSLGSALFTKSLEFDDGSRLDYSIRAINSPSSGLMSGTYLAPETFVYTEATAAPSVEPVNHVLHLDLPLLGEAASQSVQPKLTSFDAPESETPPAFSRAVLVPCSGISDPARDATWQIANSPFYVLERQVLWKLVAHNVNNTSTTQDSSVQITSGVETAKSETFSTKTGVSITVEAGVELGVFSSKVTGSVSREMGYESQTSFSELTTRTDTIPLSTQPGRAIAAWQQVSRFVLYRHNGTELEPVDSWDIGTNSHLEDEYPD
jgi:hypothetical protein